MLLSVQAGEAIDVYDRTGFVGVVAFLGLIVALFVMWRWFTHESRCVTRYQKIDSSLETLTRDVRTGFEDVMQGVSANKAAIVDLEGREHDRDLAEVRKAAYDEGHAAGLKEPRQ